MPTGKEIYVQLLDPAWQDLDKIADYHLRQVGPSSAQKITDSILRHTKRLEIFPYSCPLVPYKRLPRKVIGCLCAENMFVFTKSFIMMSSFTI